MNTVRNSIGTSALAVLLAMGLAACSQDEEATAPAQQEMAEAAMPAEEAPAAAEETAEAAPAPEVMVYFIAPAHEATLPSPVRVKFGLVGMEVAPAGTATPNTGHHHLLVDVEELPPLDQPIPSDDQHIHFGKGQTEVELELEPGEHTLQLLLGDGNHVPHNPPVVSDRITVTVTE